MGMRVVLRMSSRVRVVLSQSDGEDEGDDDGEDEGEDDGENSGKEKDKESDGMQGRPKVWVLMKMLRWWTSTRLKLEFLLLEWQIQLK